MWIPIQIELQSIDIKNCDLKRDLSTLMKLTFFCNTFSFFQYWPGNFHSCIYSDSNITVPKSVSQAHFTMRSNNTISFENLKPSGSFKLVIGY